MTTPPHPQQRYAVMTPSAPPPDPLANFPWAAVNAWLADPHGWHLTTVAADALNAWKAGRA